MTSIPQVWAGTWWSSGMWRVWGWKTGYANDGWLAGGDPLMDSGVNYNIGDVTTDEYYIKGVAAKTNGTDVTFVRCYFDYPDGTHSNAYLNKTTSVWNEGKDKYWERDDVFGSSGYHIDKTTAGDYKIDIHFKLGYSDNSEQSENWRVITWTIPGFNPTSTSKSFGTTIPVNTESETTISFTHYGSTTVSSSNSYSITGTNRTEFEVRSISNDGVNVVFKPISAGSKSATLTITDGYSKTFTITLTGTAVAQGTKTRLYFNDYRYHSAWIDEGAKYRFSCEYTSGVYTHYVMSKCDNSAYNYYADVEIKTGSISVDRYNPSSPYNTWNSITPGLSSSNRYAVLDNFSDYVYYGFATNHPYNDVSGGNIYYDNSKSGLTNTLYVVIGHDYKMSNGGIADEYSKVYALGNIGNTKLYYLSLSDTWHDADYYAFIGASSAPSDGTWGSDDLSSKASSSSYTGIYRDIMDLESGSSYLGFAATKTDGTLSLKKSPTLNTTQTFNYALSTDGGTVFTPMTSGGPNTPGQLSMASFEFTNAACTTAVAKAAQTLSANATSYTKAVSNVAYTGTTTLTASSLRDGYTFVGWYVGSTQRASGTSFTYYPQGDSTFTARYRAHRYTINFNANDDQYSSAPAATGTTASMTNVVYDQSATLTANGFHRIGYKFIGWSTTEDGDVAYTNGATAIFNLTTSDGGSETLYAQWEADKNTFTNAAGDGDWSNEGNWSEGTVPTNDDAEITISDDVTISSGTSVHVGSVDVSEGKLTIEAGGALEVAGTITNTDASKIVIKSNTTSQGVLIFNSTGSTAATVNMTMNAASGMFQFIAIPVSYVDVSDAFAGTGAFSYVWKNSAHDWEKRGYYDGISSFEAVIAKGKASTSFAGNLVSNTFSSGSLTYSAGDYGDVFMFGNSWPAPIKHSAMTLTNIASVNILKGSDNSWEGVVDDDVIPALQAYAVVVEEDKTGSVSIDYDAAVRSVTSGRTAPLKAPQRTTSDEQGPISIYVRGNEMQTRIRLYEDATHFSDELDAGWEAYYMKGEGYAGDLYAVGPERKMNVLATSNLEGTVVGFVPGQATDYTISFAGDGKGYYLNDVKKEESTLIAEGNTYEFTSDPSTNATRFVISKTPIAKTPTSIDNTNDGVKARKQLIDGALYIIRDGRIYTVTGALVK